MGCWATSSGARCAVYLFGQVMLFTHPESDGERPTPDSALGTREAAVCRSGVHNDVHVAGDEGWRVLRGGRTTRFT